MRTDPHPESRATQLSGKRLAVFTATVAAAVGLGTLPSFAFGILAPFLRNDFDLTRFELGLLTTALFLVAAPGSLAAGRVVDTFRTRSVLVANFAIVAATTVGLALSPSFAWMVAVAAVAGIPLALCNPITNKLVMRHVQESARGVVMGIKQSGVQIGAFLAGALLPSAARAWGWRVAVALAGAVAALGILGALSVPHSTTEREPKTSSDRVAANRGIKALAVYAFLMGAGMTAVLAYLPLYGVERIGLTTTAAGSVGSTIGFTGIFARIIWGWRSGTFMHLSSPLVVMSGGSVIAVALVLVAAPSFSWVLWAAAVILGATGAAWMAIVMLAVLTEADRHQTGRASGMVVFGFFSGCVSSPLAFGFVVDVTESYTLGWSAALALFAAAGLMAVRWRRAWRREISEVGLEI